MIADNSKDAQTEFAPVVIPGLPPITVRLVADNPQCIVDPDSPRDNPWCEGLNPGNTAPGRRRLQRSVARTSRKMLQQQLPMAGDVSRVRTLTCGDEHNRIFGWTGYEKSNYWCYQAKTILMAEIAGEGDQGWLMAAGWCALWGMAVIGPRLLPGHVSPSSTCRPFNCLGWCLATQLPCVYVMGMACSTAAVEHETNKQLP